MQESSGSNHSSPAAGQQAHATPSSSELQACGSSAWDSILFNSDSEEDPGAQLLAAQSVHNHPCLCAVHNNRELIMLPLNTVRRAPGFNCPYPCMLLVTHGCGTVCQAVVKSD